MRWRVIAVATALLMLSGCTDADWDHLLTYSNPAAPSGPAATPVDRVEEAPAGRVAPPPAYQAPISPVAVQARAAYDSSRSRQECASLARQRQTDAAFSEHDKQLLEQVYSRTLADCMAWNASHGR